MKRVLVFGMTENPGGVENFLMTYYRRIDQSAIQFDFLCNTHNKVAYEDELIGLGARMFHITSRRENRRRFYDELNGLFREKAGEWHAIWVNVSSLANIDYLIAAKKAGIRKRIIHSHNSGNMEGIIRRILHEGNRMRIGKYATDLWACSDIAARWFYRKPLLDRAVIVSNAIDVESKQFDPEKREEIRKRIGWEDKFIIGNVGRLHFQKNQTFLIDVFSKYHSMNPDSRLVMVGQGEDEAKLKGQVKALGLRDEVLFTGVQSDVQAWLSSFDLFCLPSVFEGFGIVTLEAEANGLPVLVSECSIPEELRINGNVRSLSLERGCEEWAQVIEEMRGIKREKPDAIRERIRDSGFDIRTEVRKLEQLLA